MSRENVSTEFKFGDSDAFMLTDIDTDESLTMIPCDTAGNFSWTGVTRAPLTRNAMQTSNTSNQYSDLERPWISIPQENWTGGRGNDIFTKDTTRYRDGKRAQASFNECIYNGPLDYYSKGFRKAETNCPGSLTWKKLKPGGERYICTKVTPSETLQAGELYIHLRRRGTPTTPLVVELVNMLGANPTVYASHTYTTSEITDTLAEFAKFTFDPVTLTAGNNYYIRVHADTGTNEDYWQIGIKTDYQPVTYVSTDGTKYDPANFEMYYRIAETQTDFQTKFFYYEQLTFMVRQKIGTTPTLWMNGDIGKTTARTATVITDSSKSWAVNAYKGARIGLVYKNGSQEYATVWRTIVSNTATSVTVDKAWDITPAVDCIYIINDTPLWNQITGHGLTSYITDIHVIKGVVYFAQGDYVDVRKMRWNNGSFEWMTLTDIKASFLQSVRDSVGMMIYRGRNDGINNKRTVERARLLDWESSTTTWTTVTTAITNKEPLNESDSVTTTTNKSGDGDNTTTTTTETSTHKIDGVTTGTTTTTTQYSTWKEQVPESDVFENTTVKTVNGETTTTRIAESTTHMVGDIETQKTDVSSRIVEKPGNALKEIDDETVGDDIGGEISSDGKTITIGTNTYQILSYNNAMTWTKYHAKYPARTLSQYVKYLMQNGAQISINGTDPNLSYIIWGDDIVESGTGTSTTDSNSTTKQESTTKTVTPKEPTTGTGVDSGSSETVTRTTTKDVYVLRTSIVTASKNFGSCDYDAKQYVITIGSFTSDNNSGRCVITLQESEDNSAFKDVATVTATGAGAWRLFAHCQYPYRRFQITASGTNCTVNNISITTSQTLHFEDPVILLDNYGKITRLFEYGAEMTKSLWIAQEGMLSSINKVDGTTDTYTHDRINLDELQTTAEAWNAKSMATADVYLLWGWLNGLQRYYNTQLEGKGPDHDEGLPFERQGRVSQIVSYPSNFFISIDAEDGYSCVMQFNQSGWHEIYRAPNKGERIYDMGFQPIYGERPDRLWLNVGDDVIWLTMPSKILYAIQDSHAEYTHESVLVSSWHTAGMMDIEKLWQTLKIMADFLDGKNCWVEADYQTDEETVWHPIKNWYVESPSQKEELNPNSSVNGKKLRYRLRLQSTDMYKTPKVNVVVLEAVGRVDIKMSYNFYFRNIKYKRDLNAEFEDIEPLDVQNVLDNWANKLKKLRMNSRWKIFDDKLVYLDAVQTSVLNELSEGYIGQITLNEL